MDLAKYKPSERQIDIVTPDGKKQLLGLRLNIVSIEDERMTKMKRAFLDERIRLEQRGKTLKAEKIEENERELAASAIVSWEWYNPTGFKGDKSYDETRNPTFNGEQPAFSKHIAINIFKELPWLLKQVVEEVSEESSFFTH